MAQLTKELIKTLNEDVARKRQLAYVRFSDPLYIAFNKYIEFGETDKAAEAKAEWKAKVIEIDSQYPYYDPIEDTSKVIEEEPLISESEVESPAE